MSAPLFQTCNANIYLFFQKQTFFLKFLISSGFSGRFHECGRMENRVGNRSESKNLIGELKEIESIWFLRHWLFLKEMQGGGICYLSAIYAVLYSPFRRAIGINFGFE